MLTSASSQLNNNYPLYVEYSKWFSNNQGDYPGTDRFNFFVSNDAGENWLLLESSSKSDTVWNQIKLQLSKHIKITDKMQFKFSAEDILHDEDLSTSIHMISSINNHFFSILLQLYYALIFSFTLYIILKIPEKYPGLLPGISRDEIKVTAFGNYKSVIAFISLIIASTFRLLIRLS